MPADDLKQIMNQVAASAAFLAAERSACHADDELSAFARLDPLLAALRKQYLDARDIRFQSCREHGEGDALAEIAMLSEDSAWCAMQARLIELKTCRDAAGRARRLLEEARRERTRQTVRAMRLREIEMHERTRAVARHGGDEIVFIWLLWLTAQRERATLMFRAPPSASFNAVAA